MDRTANLLGALALLLTDALTDATRDAAGRSGAAAAALAVLAQEPGQGIEALRAPLGLTHSAAVRLIDARAADGCARRGPGGDGRSVSVTLTEAGQARGHAVLDRRAAVLDGALAPLGPAERATLTGLLERMLTWLTTDRVQAERTCRLCRNDCCPAQRCPVDLAAAAVEAAGADRRAEDGSR
jgi:DNA-binding MarR family transcriptional regulator